jgi:hypothetical protein
MDTGLRIALSTGFFGRDLALGVAARSVCRSWREAVRGHVAPELKLHALMEYEPKRVELADVPGWCASFPQAKALRCAATRKGDGHVPLASTALAGMRRLRHLHVSVGGLPSAHKEALMQAVPVTTTHLELVGVFKDEPFACRVLSRLTGLQHVHIHTELTAKLAAALPPTVASLVTAAMPAGAERVSLAHLPLLRDFRIPFLRPRILATVTPHLRSLDVGGDASLDAGLLRRFTSLQRLRWHAWLDGAALAALPPTLEELMAYTHSSDDGPQPSLAHLTRLRDLDICVPEDTSVARASAFVRSFPPSLRKLLLCSMPEIGDDPFAHLSALEDVALISCAADDEIIASLPPSVRRLVVGARSGVTSTCTFAHLPRLHCLRTAPSMLDAGIAAAASLSREARLAWLATAVRAHGGGGLLWPLRELHLLSTGRVYPVAFQCPDSLTTLSLSYCDMSGCDLSRLTQLHTLKLNRCTNVPAAVASAPPSLRVLDVSGTPAAFLSHFPPSLHELCISYWHPEALLHPPPGLRKLELHFRKTNDAWGLPVDLSGTRLEVLLIHGECSTGPIDGSMFATLPPTMRVVSGKDLLVALPPATTSPAADGAAGALRLDLTHLPVLQRCDLWFADGHAPVTVAAMGREWVEVGMAAE